MTAEIATPQNTSAITRAEKTNDRWMKAVVVIAVLTLLGVGTTLWLRFGDAAKQSTTQHAANAVLLSAERADCRTAYNSDRTTVIEHAAIIERQNVAAVVGYLLGNPAFKGDTLAANKAALDAVNKAVTDLPTLNEMVDHGYALNGVRHPPCPKVK